LLSPKYRARKQGTDETTLASSYINLLLEVRQGMPWDMGLNSAIYLLSESGRGILLAWLSSEEATPEAIEDIRIFFNELAKFDTERQTRLVSTLGGRLLQRSYSSHFDKGNQAAEKTIHDKKKMLFSAADVEPQMIHWDSRTTVTRRLSTMTVNVATTSTTKGAFASAGTDAIKSLLSELKLQLHCDAVLLVSSGANQLPRLLSTNSLARVLDEDWSVSSGTPLGLAIESKKPVAVSNILTDPRFELAKLGLADLPADR